MSSNKTIHPSLIRAYRDANYVVEIDGSIKLRVGEANQQLKQLLKAHKVASAAFITAFNPFSQTLSDDENLQAQSSLLAEVKSLGYFAINGYGQDVEGRWPKEQSALILGITETQSEFLSDKYGQNAFVWIGSLDAFPVLRLRYPIGLPATEDFAQWLNALPEHLRTAARELSSLDQAWLMSVSEAEQEHWLNVNLWDLNNPWPLAKPDGSAMGIGTELDRVFKLIAAGQSSII